MSVGVSYTTLASTVCEPSGRTVNPETDVSSPKTKSAKNGVRGGRAIVYGVPPATNEYRPGSEGTTDKSSASKSASFVKSNTTPNGSVSGSLNGLVCKTDKPVNPTKDAGRRSVWSNASLKWYINELGVWYCTTLYTFPSYENVTYRF